MSRKHYRAIAEVLAADYAIAATEAERRVVANITRSLADVLKRDNSNFDRARFYAAVGISREA
jgi:hypothetical protein